MLSCCGLNCSKCEAYLATQADNDEMRAGVAKEWSERYNADIKTEHINCNGCRSDGSKFFYCSDICELRKCCLEKKLDNCAACNMYACDKLEAFFRLAPEAQAALDALRH
jgi:hypothetical protein